MDERPSILCGSAGKGAREGGTKLWKVVVGLKYENTKILHDVVNWVLGF